MKLFRCSGVSIGARNCWILSGWTQTRLLTLLTKKFDRDCQLFPAMSPLESVKALVSIMNSVGRSNEGHTFDICRAHFQGTAHRLIYVKLSAEDCQKNGEHKVGKLMKSMYGTKMRLTLGNFVNLICAESGGFRRSKHSAASFVNPRR